MALEIHSIKCSGPPLNPPTFENQHWVDTTSGDLYISNGTTSLANWVLLGQAPTITDTVTTSATKFVDSNPLAIFCAIDYTICMFNVANNVYKTIKIIASKVAGGGLSHSTYGIIGGGIDAAVDIVISTDQKLEITNNEAFTLEIRATKLITKG